MSILKKLRMLCVALFVLSFVVPAHAATFTVSKVADTNDGTCNSDCSLREAITAANATAGADTILFDATAFSAMQTISIESALPKLTHTVTITGPSARLTVKKGATSTVFDILSVNLGASATVNNLTLSNGGYGFNNAGGTATITNCICSGNTYDGIVNAGGTLTAIKCTAKNNASYGIFNMSGILSATGCTANSNGAAGIFNNNSATLTAVNCTANNNHSGGFSLFTGTLTATKCTAINNSSFGFYNVNGTLNATDCTANENLYEGIRTVSKGATNALRCTLNNNKYPGILNDSGTLAIDNCVLTGNSPFGVYNTNGGKLTATNCTLSDTTYDLIFNNTNSSATIDNCIISGNSAYGIYNSGTLNATDCTLSGSSTSAFLNGGTLTVDRCTMTGNSAYGIYNSGTLNATDCTLSGSSTCAFLNGGTLTANRCTMTGNLDGMRTFGGTVAMTNCSIVDNSSLGTYANNSATVTLTNCNISGNQNYGIENNNGSKYTVTNCTLSGNAHGISNNGGSLTATNCTITATPSYGIHNLSTLTLKNTICVGNYIDIFGGFIDGGNNITTGTAAEAGLDPLGLKNNGGPTQTVALLSGGTAVNAGSNPLIQGFPTDQRGPGFPRIIGGTVDVGAYELPPSISINDKSITEGNSGTTNLTFKVTLSVASPQAVTVDFATTSSIVDPATAGTDYVPATGTITFAPGQISRVLVVPIIGDTLDEGNESFTVNLGNATGALLADAQGVGTIIDNDTSTISINDVTIVENDSGPKNMKFTVTLSNPSSKTVTVDYATADSPAQGAPAKAGSDYELTTGTVTFSSGQTIKTFIVPSTGDVLDENNETYFVNLSNAVNATITDNQGLGTINDNDAAPTLSIDDISFVEGPAQGAPAGTTNAEFTLTLSAVSGRAVSVNFATVDGTAKAGEDYNARTGAVTFQPGQTSKIIAVGIKGDTVFESDETFKVNLSGATNANIGGAPSGSNQGICTIANDDAAALLFENDEPSS